MVHEVVRGLFFNFPKPVLSACSLESCARIGPRTIKKIMIYGFHFNILKLSRFTQLSETCSQTVPRSIKVITVNEYVRSLQFNFLKLWIFTVLSGICSWAGARTFKVITVREVVCIPHFNSPKCGSSESSYNTSHFTVTLTVREVDHELSRWSLFLLLLLFYSISS